MRVVLRSSGERTHDIAVYQLRNMGFDVVVVNEQPFPLAFQRCLELISSSSQRWVYVWDADSIPIYGGFRSFASNLSKYDPSTTIAITGGSYDYIFGAFRYGPLRAYSVERVRSSFESGQTFDCDEVRPESQFIRNASKKGVRAVRVPIYVGVHDAEQYRSDYFRKGYLHSQKSVKMLPAIITEARHEMPVDDGEALLQGVAAGLLGERSGCDAKRSLDYSGSEKAKLIASEFDALVALWDARLESMLWKLPLVRYGSAISPVALRKFESVGSRIGTIATRVSKLCGTR